MSNRVGDQQRYMAAVDCTICKPKKEIALIEVQPGFELTPAVLLEAYENHLRAHGFDEIVEWFVDQCRVTTLRTFRLIEEGATVVPR